MHMLEDNASVCALQQFSSDIADNASTVCLAHLFTYQDFDEGTLGLAYVAPSKPQALGGLCPKRKDTSLSSKLLCFDKPDHLMVYIRIYIIQHSYWEINFLKCERL